MRSSVARVNRSSMCPSQAVATSRSEVGPRRLGNTVVSGLTTKCRFSQAEAGKQDSVVLAGGEVMRVLVTGASGWIGSGLVPDLLSAGHEVVGLARSEDAAAAITALGARPQMGSLEDIETVKHAADSVDGVVHLAFRHDLVYSGDMAGAAVFDRQAIEAMGAVLAGSERPLVIASGILGVAPGRPVTEDDAPPIQDTGEAAGDRMANAEYTMSLGSQGVRSAVVRLPPMCHGEGDNGFTAILVNLARQKGVSGYVGDGSARWPATHRLDVARAFRLALEKAPAGSTFHAVAEEGIPGHAFAEVIGHQLGVPVQAIPDDGVMEHFGFLGAILALDSPASSEKTRNLLDWNPSHPDLLDDLSQKYYY